MIIRKAKVTEAKRIKEIIDIHAQRGMMLSRSLDDIYASVRDFTVCEVDHGVVGVSALTVFTEELAEIRSLAVEDTYRHRNIGAHLLEHCVTEAIEYDISHIFTLTYIPQYFKKLHFKSIPKDQLPHKIWRDCMSCQHFYHCDEEAMIYEVKV